MLFWFAPVRPRESVSKRREPAFLSRKPGMIPPECLPNWNRFFQWLLGFFAKLKQGFWESLKP